MGFRRPDLDRARHDLRLCMIEIASPYNDGFTSSSCKHDLYQLKCWLDDAYSKLPTFVGEEKWAQERVIEILKQ
jgi:hypothetical protein